MKADKTSAKAMVETLEADFDFAQCIPTEDDFVKIAKRWQDYREHGVNAELISRPRTMVGCTASKYKVIRYMLVAAFIGQTELVEEAKKKLKQYYDKEDMQQIFDYVKRFYTRYSSFITKYKPRLEEQAPAKPLEEANGNLTPEQKMDLWYQGKRNLNVAACSDGKLGHYWEICWRKGYFYEADILRNEAKKRGLFWGKLEVKLTDPQLNLTADDFETGRLFSLDNIFTIMYKDPQAWDNFIKKQFLVFTPDSISFYKRGLALLIVALAFDRNDLVEQMKSILTRFFSSAELRDYIQKTIDKPDVLRQLAELKKEQKQTNESLETEEKEGDLEEAIEKHDTLNPKLWNEDETLKPEVKEKIDLIVGEFLKSLAKDDVKIKVKDVVLIGSNCSYNYTDASDLDVHIIVETKSLKCPDELYPTLYSAYRRLFECKFDIEFYGIPVEIYVETERLPTVSKGCYSVKDDKWIKKPVLEEIPNVDQTAFDDEFAKWTTRFDELIADLKKEYGDELTEGLDNDALHKIDAFVDDVYALRKNGLEKEGEYGTGNLVFKELRNNGYLDRLWNLKDKIVEKELSLYDGDERQLGEGFLKECQGQFASVGCQNAVIQPNGRFDLHGIDDSKINGILVGLRQLPCVDFVDKSCGRIDLANLMGQGGNASPVRNYDVYGWVRLPIEESLPESKAEAPTEENAEAETDEQGYELPPDVHWWQNPEDGSWNPTEVVDGRKTRLRAGILIVKDGNELLLGEEAGEPGVLSLPGGAINKGETVEEAACREAEEEAFKKVKDARYTGIAYLTHYDEAADWVKEHVPEDEQWIDCKTFLVIGEYDGEYEGKIDEKDFDASMAFTAKFYPIEEALALPSFKSEWKEALVKFGYIAENE